MAERDTLTVRGKNIVVQRDEIEIGKLKFYLENPRIYDSLREVMEGETPDQQQIKDFLMRTEDVRNLKKDIEANGGLTDPVIVRRDNLQVIEGNRRLAAYIDLHQNSPSDSKWKKIKCLIIQDVTDSDINAILGQYHLKGKKEWRPYEQAGFIYRRNKNDKMAIDKISQELGITKNRVNNFIKVYEFMQKHGGKKEQWSYYEAYLNVRATKGKGSVKEARESNPMMDEIIVEKIQSREIDTAQHLRDRLPYIVTNRKALKSFLEGDSTFEESWERVRKTGSTDNYVERIKTFQDWLADNEAKIREAIGKQDEVGNKLKYQVRGLKRIVRGLKSD